MPSGPRCCGTRCLRGRQTAAAAPAWGTCWTSGWSGSTCCGRWAPWVWVGAPGGQACGLISLLPVSVSHFSICIRHPRSHPPACPWHPHCPLPCPAPSLQAQPIQDWLCSAARRAASGQDLPDSLTAADWACVRDQAFPASPENQYAHLRLHDFSDTVARLPPEEIHGMAGGEPVCSRLFCCG
jgi:hypothetical protein